MAELVPIDDFGSYSDGDISTQGTPWDIGSPDDWDVESSGAATQGKLLRNDHLEGDFQVSTNIASDSGLNAYPQKGGLTQVWVRLASGEATGFYFGGPDLLNTYEIELDTTNGSNNSSAGIIEWDSGGTTYIDENTGLTLPTTSTARVDIYWDDPDRTNDIEVEVYDTSDSSLVTSLAANVNVSYNTGLVGMYGEGSGTAWDTIKTETNSLTRTAASFAQNVYSDSTIQRVYQRLTETFTGTTNVNTTRSLASDRNSQSWLNAINSDNTRASALDRLGETYTNIFEISATDANAVDDFESYNLGDVDTTTTAWTGSGEIADADTPTVDSAWSGQQLLLGSATSTSGLPRYPEKGTRTVFYHNTGSSTETTTIEFAYHEDTYPGRYGITINPNNQTITVYQSETGVAGSTTLTEVDLGFDPNNGYGRYEFVWEVTGSIRVIAQSTTHDSSVEFAVSPSVDLSPGGIRVIGSTGTTDYIRTYSEPFIKRIVQTFTNSTVGESNVSAQTILAETFTNTNTSDSTPGVLSQTHSKAMATTSTAREIITKVTARMGQARHGEARHGLGVPRVLRNALTYTKTVATKSTKSSVFGRVADTFTSAINSDSDRSSSNLRNLTSYLTRSDSDSDRSLSLSRLGETYTGTVLANAIVRIIRIASTYTPTISSASDRSSIFDRQPITYTKTVSQDIARSKYMPRSVVQFTGQVRTSAGGLYRRVLKAVTFTGSVGTSSTGVSGLARKGVTYTKNIAASAGSSLLGFIPIKPLKAQVTDNTKSAETQDNSKNVMVRKSSTSVKLKNDK